MSFSASAKAEACHAIPGKHCCALADCIKIITESREFAYIIPKLFKKAFDLTFDSFPSMESPGKLVFQIMQPDKIAHIMSAFGSSPQDTLALNINLPVVEEDC